jgi:competence protein ComEC
MTLFAIAIAWLLGLGLGSQAALPTWQWLTLAALALAASLVFRRGKAALLFVGLVIVFSGAARLQSSRAPPVPSDVRFLNDSGQMVTLLGIVTDYPDVRDSYTGIRVRVRAVIEDGTSLAAEGLVLVHADRDADWAYGDVIQAAGRLETPPEFPDFSYRDYLARQGVYSLMARADVTRVAVGQGSPVLRAVYTYRTRAQAVLRRLFPEPEASLLAGILLGIESGIPDGLRQAYNATGTAHIIAISGFNVAIIAGLFGKLFTRWLGARRGAIAALLGIAVYTVLVGAGASVVRAALMAGLVIVAQRLGRQNDALAAMGAAAILMTLVQPMTLWDVGFQLSFGATLGLVLYAEPLQTALARAAGRWLEPKRAARLGGLVGEYALFTLAAQVTTLPLTALYFHRFSLVAWIANPLILPAQPAVMMLGGLAALAGTLWLPLARPLAWIAWPFVGYTNRLVEWFATWPSASIPLGETSLAAVAAYFAVLFGLTFGLPTLRVRWPTLRLPSVTSAVGLGALAFSVFFVWRSASDQPDGQLHVTLLDVGAGGAVLVQTPSGRAVLIDSGPSPVALAEALGRRLPFNSPAIDVFVLSGSASEPCGGLQGLEGRFPVAMAILPRDIAAPECRAMEARLLTAGTRIVRGEAGLALSLGAGARLEVLAASPRGMVLGLSYGKARFLLPLGIDPEMMDSLLHSGRLAAAHVLVLADGGYAAVNPPELFNRLRPLAAVIGVEADDRRRLPSPEVLEALEGTTVLRTDRNGWIEFRTDGDWLWVEVERP